MFDDNSRFVELVKNGDFTDATMYLCDLHKDAMITNGEYKTGKQYIEDAINDRFDWRKL